MMTLKILSAWACICTVAACASGGGAPAPSAAPQAAPQAAAAAAARSAPARRDRNLITRDELKDPSIRSLNVLDAIRTLRPNFLSSRGTQTIVNDANRGVVDTESGRVHASIDDSGVLQLDDLKRISVSSVVEIRLLSPAAAMQRFGATAKQGAVIAVRTM